MTPAIPSQDERPQATVERGDCTYTELYCEENVYKLCEKLIADKTVRSDDLHAVFITNPRKQVPLWSQSASSREDGLVVWDYHVIAVQAKREGDNGRKYAQVWDLDTKLDFPCALHEYAAHTFGLMQLRPEFERRFRVVPAAALLRGFASDRSHMRAADGSWSAPPPAYPPIVAEDGATHRLDEYLDVSACHVSAATSAPESHATSALESHATSAPESRATSASSTRTGARADEDGSQAHEGAARWMGSVMAEQAFLAAFGA